MISVLTPSHSNWRSVNKSWSFSLTRLNLSRGDYLTNSTEETSKFILYIIWIDIIHNFNLKQAFFALFVVPVLMVGSHIMTCLPSVFPWSQLLLFRSTTTVAMGKLCSFPGEHWFAFISRQNFALKSGSNYCAVWAVSVVESKISLLYKYFMIVVAFRIRKRI